MVSSPLPEFDVNGPVLRALRLKDGWSIADFAREIELTPGHVSNIEAGRRGCSPKVIKRMAEVLAVPMSVLQRERVAS